jgi:type IV pilus assembly protein PilN
MTITEPETPLLDLLRERRSQLGLLPMSALLAERRRLLVRGTAIGAALLGLVLASSALIFLRHQVVKSQMGKLQQVEGEFSQLQEQTGTTKARVEAIIATNRRLAEGLTSVRTSSAVLTELQLRTPESVQLITVDLKQGALQIKGEARDPNAFERINALQLELQRSPLLEDTGVSLTKVERKTDDKAAQEVAGVPAPVGFELTANFATLPPARQLELLRQLGSGGMARRLQLLQREGLLP